MAVERKIERIYDSANTNDPVTRCGFFTTRMRRVLATLDYRLVLGSVYPHDPQIPFWSVNAWHVLSIVRPGAIIVCHDGRSWTAPMLRRVLPVLKRRGYRVVTVTELLRGGVKVFFFKGW
ncbi:hypothetical protein PABG_11278 [Paracoccidioides brasiliensis Pb03]|nr:hypothetical protein PABG_11278 [Paracoccidioides brasiliensis Pb03]